MKKISFDFVIDPGFLLGVDDNCSGGSNPIQNLDDFGVEFGDSDIYTVFCKYFP